MSTPVSRLSNYANDSSAKIPISSAEVDAEMNAWVAALNRKVVVKSTAPSSPTIGDTWVDSTTLTVKYYDGSSWYAVGGISYSSVIAYSTGDIVNSGGVVYISLQSGNRNNTPASSPTYWAELIPQGTQPSDFVVLTDNYYAFPVTGVTTVPAAGQTYTTTDVDSGTTTYTILAGSNKSYVYASGAKAPKSDSVTLTKTSGGTGDATITFTAAGFVGMLPAVDGSLLTGTKKITAYSANGTTNINTSSTSYADMSQMTLSVTVASGQTVYIWFTTCCTRNGGAGSSGVRFQLMRDSSVLAFTTIKLPYADDSAGSLAYIDSPAAGTYTYKIQWKAEGDTITCNPAVEGQHRTLITFVQ